MAQPAPAPSSLIPSTVRSYQLDKLSSTNYLTWATQVTLLLKRTALWDIISGTTPKPAANDADWLAKDLQAQSELMLHLGDRQVQMVRRCQSSPVIFAFLRSTYHHEDLITRVTALKKLLLAVLTEHQDISKFLDDWRTLLDNALLSGLLLDDSLQAMLLLAALPTSWRPFITTQASVGITYPPQLTHPANPFNSADPASSTSVPRIEWEKEDVLRYIPLPNQPQVPPIQQIPSSPVPIGTPLPPNAPPWSLGRKTKTHLFPNIPHPLPVEPTAASSNPPHIQPSNSTPTSSSTPTNPYVPENPIHQPSLLGPSPTSRPSKSSKVRSLKEIYQNSHHSLLMDPSPSSTPIISDCLHEASFLDVAAADALYHQVLQAFSDNDFERLLLVVETIDEISLDEALSGPEASSWRQAMDSEYQSLTANGTWQLVPAPPSRKLVTCKWLLRKKFHADGSVSRYKARLVACGFTQIPGMDYSETFSPVLRITSFRVLIAIAALFGFLLHQMDVRTAFLNGDLQEEIYMSQPDGGYTSLQHPDYVCRLLKALYGLKQSPRQWYLRFHQCMISLGYTRFQSDANVYSRHSINVLLFLAIYVDDILILSNSQYAIDKAKGELQASFSMIDMGTLHYCLGIQVLQDPSKGLIRISQQTYIQSLLTKFNMSSCKGVETPLPTSLKLKQPDSTLTVSTETQSFPFANILGGIRYLVTCTRPGICFATNLLSRYMKAPSLQHIQHLKRLMRYLQHTKDYGICFYATHPLPTPFLFRYSDAD
ncbi:hypothetical protein L7F22_000909 [Adiantum nelumboides]|nr:hypothetical protein [Adiantum nelumboides]